MQEAFRKHIEVTFPSIFSKKVLVAVSGGIDSVVLVHLLHMLKINIALAHCNFQLRGEESQHDEQWIIHLARHLNLPYFSVRFDTVAEAKKQKESIQVAARRLRYTWFDGIANQHDFTYIATAHHLNDSLENYLMHSIRGTGIKGLLGVPQQTHQVIRPLLPFSKEELIVEAKKNNWTWREDTSNSKNAYFRNRIRNQIIPLLQKENPNLLSSFQQTLQHLQQSYDLLEDYTQLLFRQLITKEANYYRLHIGKLKNFPHAEAILFQLLQPFGFTDWESVYDLRYAETGKKIISSTHILEKNRDEFLILVKEEATISPKIYIQTNDKEVKFANSILRIEEVTHMEEIGHSIAYLDMDKLNFPLSLRKVNMEDTFSPLGMKESKKVIHFLRDEKVPTSIKMQTWVLCSKGHIVWVVNHRIDENYKVTENTKKCLKISCTN